MANFQNILKMLRTSKGITQDGLAKALKISRSTIGMYESGSREPDFETLELIADYFNVDIDYLLGRTSKTTYIPTPAPNKGVIIKVYGRVAAGIPIEAIQDVIDEEEIPEELARTGEFFGLKISGDSMSPEIHDGDTVIVLRQDDAETDEIVIALVNGNDGVCKRLKKYKDSLSLISTNPSYAPMYFSQEEVDSKPVRIIGKVVELRRKF